MMKTPITIGQLLGVLGTLIIPLIIWGVSIETRFTEYGVRIRQNEQNYSSIKADVKEIKETTNLILLRIEKLAIEKQDRQ